MTEKDLRKLGRADILEMFLTVSQENEKLSEKLNVLSAEQLAMKKRVEELTEGINQREEELDTQAQEIVELKEQLASAQGEIADAQADLADRSLAIDEAGSIAEAAMKVNGIFEAAEATAKQYLDNIKNLSARQTAICDAREQEHKKKCASMLAETEKICLEKMELTNNSCESMRARVQSECDEMRAKATEESEALWKSMETRLEDFYESHVGMREIMQFFFQKVPTVEDLKAE